MTARQALHRIVDELPDEDLATARRVLEALWVTTFATLDDLLTAAPLDDEVADDDFDGGLSQARHEVARGELLGTHDVLRALGEG